MESVLLQVTRKLERRKLEDMLSAHYHIVLPDAEKPMSHPFDVAIIDGASIRELRPVLEERRKAEEPVILPFLLLSARKKDSMHARHLGRIVDDLILRPLNQDELLARVGNLLRMRRWSSEVKKEHDRVMKLAVTDDVTGFNNTRYLHRNLDRLFDAAQNKAIEFCLAFFDMDHFKNLVDEHGHLFGSKALKEVAQTVAEHMAEDDRLVRYGGDEFIVILPRQGKADALAKISRMQEAIASHEFLQKEGINARLTASFGVAAYPEDAADKKELLAEADRCLFKSKTEGRGRIVTADGGPAEAEPFRSAA